MQTITIVLDGGMVQNVYAADNHIRVIVLDLDIEGADRNDPRMYMDHAWVQEHSIESYQDMPDNDRKAREKFLTEKRSSSERTTTMKPYSVLLLYPDTGHNPETYYQHTWAESPEAAIAHVRAEAAGVNPGMEGEEFLPLIVLPDHIEAELFFRDVAPW